MDTRSLDVWYGEYAKHIPPDESYAGPYFEDYEELPAHIRSNPAGWTAFRIGRIHDSVRNCVAAFRQAIRSRDDARPDGLFAVQQADGGFSAWGNGAGGSTHCSVWDFTVRKPTEEENHVVSTSRDAAKVQTVRPEPETTVEDVRRAPRDTIHEGMSTERGYSTGAAAARQIIEQHEKNPNKVFTEWHAAESQYGGVRCDVLPRSDREFFRGLRITLRKWLEAHLPDPDAPGLDNAGEAAVRDFLAKPNDDVKTLVREGIKEALAAGLAKAPAPTKPAAAPDAKPVATADAAGSGAGPEYVFRRSGDFWEIVFDGRKIDPVRRLAGMAYLRALLARPGHHFTACDLSRLENPLPPEAVRPLGGELSPEEREKYGTGGGAQRVLERKTPAKLRKAKAEIEKELEADDLSDKQREYLECQKEAIDEALTNTRVATAIGGATFEQKEQKQPRQAVSNAIERAIDAISEKQHGGNLAKHLSGGAVRKGKTFSYVGGLTWVT